MKKASLMVALSLVLALVGCSSGTSTGTTSSSNAQGTETQGSTQPAASDKKDTLTVAMTSDAVILDPQHMNDNTSEQVIKMLYNGLLKFDEKSQIVGDLADSWEVSEDGKTWTFKLKSGIKFQDGSDFNAQAVKASFDRVINKENGLNRYQLYEMITEVKAVDDTTVTFTTNEPFGAFPAIMAHTSGGILSPKAIETFGKELGKTAESTIGTGPYKVVEWKKDQQIVLERNDAYWGEKGVTPKIVYRPIPEAASRVIALETGEVDVVQGVPANELKRLEGMSEIRVIKVPGNGSRLFRFNLAKKPLDNPKVRQAISYAVNRQEILDNVVTGMGELSTGPLAKVLFGYTDLGSIPYDPEKAKALLAEAGFPNGFKTKITTTERYIQGTELAEAISAQLKKVGIEAEIDVREWSSIVKEWDGLTPEEFTQEIFIMGAGASTMDADWGLRPNYTTATTNELNYGFYSNKEYDELIAKAKTETDPEKRKELYKRAEEILYLEDPAGIWLYDQFVIVATGSKVKDVTVSPLSLVMFEKAYVEK